MTFSDKLLYHHNHPAKLAADGICLIAGAVLIWQQHLYRAIAVGVGGPLLASAVVLAFVTVPPSRTLTWPIVALRVAGALVFWIGAWYRSVFWCAVGIVIIAFDAVRGRLPRIRI